MVSTGALAAPGVSQCTRDIAEENGDDTRSTQIQILSLS